MFRRSHVSLWLCALTQIVRLQISVEKNSKVSSTTGTATRAVINWKAVQDEMGRKAVDCCNKYNCLRYHTLKKGPFDDKEVSYCTGGGSEVVMAVVTVVMVGCAGERDD